MLAANLSVCQYAGMPGQSNSNTSASNHNNINTNNSHGNNINSNLNNNSESTNSTSNNPINPINSGNQNINNNNNTTNNLTNNNNSNNIRGNGNPHIGLLGGGTSALAAKNQLEQLNTMREALFSQDGWGCQHVNQDTNWEVPSSPEPNNKDSSGPPLWKPTINNGTDLWETNLRNGGQPSVQTIQKTPWGHTPSTNLGGTWGEDDDSSDATNVWAGGPSNNQNASVVGATCVATSSTVGPPNGPQWSQNAINVGVGVGVAVNPGGQPNSATSGNITNVVSGVNNAPGVVSGGVGMGSTSGVGIGIGITGNGWGDPRDLRSSQMGGPLDLHSVDPMRVGEPRDLRILDPREPIRGDPRGISGRLNGTSEMWSQHHPIAHNQLPVLNKIVGPTIGANSSNVGPAIVPGSGGVSNIGGPGVNSVNASAGVAGSVINSQWGPPQSVICPKDLNSVGIAVKQSSSGWEEPSPPPQRRNIPNYDDGTSLWGQQTRISSGGTHWKDINDPRSHLMRNSIPGQNPSTSVVATGLNPVTGNSTGNNNSGLNAVVGSSNNHMTVGLGPQGRLVTGVGGPVGVNVNAGTHKPENTMWSHSGVTNVPGVGGRNPSGLWGDDCNHNVIVSANSSSNWSDDKPNPQGAQLANANIANTNAWNDQTISWNKGNVNKLPVASSWGVPVNNNNSVNDSNDLNSADWGNTTHSTVMVKTQTPKISAVNLSGISNELKQSKQFRILLDSGFKKEEVERALISTNMNMDEAADMLRANISLGMDNWRRHDEPVGSYADHTNITGGSFANRYTAGRVQTAISFPPNNILNTMGTSGAGGSNNHNLNSLNTNMQPLQVQKYLNQGSHHMTGNVTSHNVGNSAVPFGQTVNVGLNSVNPAVTNTSNQPSTQQLRMLVQQIQLAVHNGYLSSQILNQPLAPATLLLLNQLLSNIKHLQGAQQSLSRGGNNASTLVAIAKYKQQIQNLQNQINAQQAVYIKQQQQQQQQVLQQTQHSQTHINSTNTDYLRNHDAINTLQNNFSEINLNKNNIYQSTPNSQSRLNQWKLPTLDKDITSDSTDFSRAPGATKQGLLTNNVANNMVALGLQNDGTWSAGRSINDGWPESTNESENKDWSIGQAPTAYTDLVQEFEPGKPWKGSQMKSIEDDPSITPGSVVRSPLSINSTPKDADIFAHTSKSSPTELPSLGLTTSSTWSFTPSTTNQNFSSWSDNTHQELWSSTINKSSRGPPSNLIPSKASGVSSMPCTSNTSTVIGGNPNGWLGGRSVGGWTGTNTHWNSNWLLLKNLTAQIDSSTLRTLCMQHGPLLRFHLYLNQGIALCKYSTREEASKAQVTLNNCFLGNTTICAETPTENDVDNILHHLPQGNCGPISSSGCNNNNVTGTVMATSSISGTNGNCNALCNTTNTLGSNISGVMVNGANNNNGSINSNISHSANIGSTNAGSNCGLGQVGIAHCANTNNTNQNAIISNNANNSTWRQPQVPNIPNQQRSSNTGRDDFEFISQYVCSLVDD